MMQHNQPSQRPIVGILYPGEMGSTLAQVLARDGFHVVITLEGRSPRTRHLCLEAGLDAQYSFREVIHTCGVVVSLVSPAAALTLAEQFRAAAAGLPNPPLYLDANSISPVTARRIAALLSEAQLDFVDAAIYGLASQLGSRGTLFLSGASAPRVAAWFGQALRVKVVGAAPGQASTMKSLVAGLNKGLAALFLEMGVLACEADMLAEMLDAYRTYYPGVMEVVDRLVPTYPQHAGRRVQEMEELECTMRSFDLRPCVVRGSRELIAAVGALGLARQAPAPKSCPWTVPQVVEALFQQQFLRERQPT